MVVERPCQLLSEAQPQRIALCWAIFLPRLILIRAKRNVFHLLKYEIIFEVSPGSKWGNGSKDGLLAGSGRGLGKLPSEERRCQASGLRPPEMSGRKSSWRLLRSIPSPLPRRPFRSSSHPCFSSPPDPHWADSTDERISSRWSPDLPGFGSVSTHFHMDFNLCVVLYFHMDFNLCQCILQCHHFSLLYLPGHCRWFSPGVRRCGTSHSDGCASPAINVKCEETVKDTSFRSCRWLERRRKRRATKSKCSWENKWWKLLRETLSSMSRVPQV